MHNRLIREIQDKSLERARKDSKICFDERGNLINQETIPGNALLCTNSKMHVSLEKGPANAQLFSPLAEQQEEEHDGVNELISISQAASVAPTLDRKDSKLNR